MKDGLKLAALYGLKPHQLGFCGLGSEQNVLLNYLKKKKNISDKEVKEVLKTFQAAYPYYKLIARSNQINNPFDKRIIRAYWTGNGLLDKVRISDLRKMILEEFSKQGLLPKELAFQKAKLIPKNSKPHHSFHVLYIGAITGSPISRDICRPCWGKVEELKIKSQKLKVTYQPLVKNKLGKAVKKEINWDKELVSNIKLGDWISFHWNQVIEVLSEQDKNNLEKYTLITIKSLQE